MNAQGYRRIVQLLFRRSFGPTDGFTRDELNRIQSKSDYRLPKALRDFYQGVGKFKTILQAHNRFYKPARLVRMEDKLVFCEENQAVVYWGIAVRDEVKANPPVYQGINCEPMEWHIEADQCSDFLTGMIYWQAVNGGLPLVRFAQGPATLRERVRKWPLVWQDADSKLFNCRTSVLCLTRRDKQTFDVQVASTSDDELDKLGEQLGIRWLA